MLSYHVRHGRAGWFIDNTAVCYGPYYREDKAIAAAESLNRQVRERAAARRVSGKEEGDPEIAAA